MGKPPVEKLESFRNLKFRIKMKAGLQKKVYFAEIESICNSRCSKPISPIKKVSFIGFLNEFDDVIGKDCVYLHLSSEADKEWLAKRAINHGALAVISEYQIEDLPCIVVENVWHALKELSLLYFRDYSGKKVAIAGSIGKTTTKEMVECVLNQRFRTFCTPNNGNVLAYIAFEIQHMPCHIEQFVQEIDESYPNNAHDCSYVMKPDIVIITTIDNSHVGVLGGEEAVEKAILDVTTYISKKGTVIFSADDSKATAALSNNRSVSVGIRDRSADCSATDIVADGQTVEFNINYKGSIVPIKLNCPGEHNVYNAMFAFVTGKLNGMTDKEIQVGLRKYRPTSIRQNTWHSFRKTMYVDCFNANAKSVCAALDVLNKLQPRRKGRRIAVLGDIAEIDGFEDQTYTIIAKKIHDDHKVDLLVTYGTNCKRILEYQGEVIKGCHINSRQSLITYLKHEIHYGDVILFKASGSMNLESVIKEAWPFTYNFAVLPKRLKTLKWLLKTL